MTKDEKKHMSAVAALGCIACRIADLGDTPPELHHIRAGKGRGQRASNYEVIPLCPAHHRGTMHPQVPSIHMDKRKFEREFGTETELLEKIRELLGITDE